MKAVRFASYGGPEVLECVEVERPQPRAGELLVRVAAIGVNPADHKFRAGALAGHRPKVLPLIPGMDIAGTVVATGGGVTRFRGGDPVFAMLPPSRLGGYAEFVVASAGFFAQMPSTLAPHLAAALPTAGLTGVEMVEDDLDLCAGQRLLVIGGLGSVGRAAAFAGRRRGAHVTVAVRDSRIAEVHFADAAVGIGASCDVRFDAIADTVGGAVAGAYYPNLVEGGVLSSVSTVRLPTPSRSDIVVRNFVCYPDPQRLGDLAAAVLAGALVLPEVVTRPLGDAAQVHAALEGGASKKFILLP